MACQDPRVRTADSVEALYLEESRAPHPNVHLQMAYVEEGPLKLQGPLLADFSNDSSNSIFPCTRKERLSHELAKEQPVGLMALRLVQDKTTGVCP